jgi:hypothetical protein
MTARVIVAMAAVLAVNVVVSRVILAAVLVVDIVVSRVILAAHRGDALIIVLIVVGWVILAGHRDDTLVVVLVVVGRVIFPVAATVIVDVVVRAVVFAVSVMQGANIVNAARVLWTGRVMMEGLESTGQRCASGGCISLLQPLDSQTLPDPLAVGSHA